MNFKRLKIKRILILIVLLAIVFFGASSLISNIKYKKTNEYKLKEKGYSESEVEKIENALSTKEIDKVLNIDYDKNLIKFITKKYFMFSNLEEYLKYQKENDDLSYEAVISIINANSDEEWYENIRETNTEKGKLMLVNKYYGLKEDYVPEDLTLLSTRYAYEGNYVSESIIDSLSDLINSAKDEGYTFLVSQGYRSYKDQMSAYNNYEKYHTKEEADIYAARAGHSEYQTGLSILIKPYNKVVSDINASKEYEWLLENAHMYGFILRYPKDKESITGFEFDPWRYRYVGTDASRKMHEENITFDEYYAYYVD